MALEPQSITNILHNRKQVNKKHNNNTAAINQTRQSTSSDVKQGCHIERSRNLVQPDNL